MDGRARVRVSSTPEVAIASVLSVWDTFFGGEDDAKAERQKILEVLVQPGHVTVLQSGTWHSG